MNTRNVWMAPASAGNRSSAKEASVAVTCFQLLTALPKLNHWSRSSLLQLSPLSSNFWTALAEVFQRWGWEETQDNLSTGYLRKPSMHADGDAVGYYQGGLGL